MENPSKQKDFVLVYICPTGLQRRRGGGGGGGGGGGVTDHVRRTRSVGCLAESGVGTLEFAGDDLMATDRDRCRGVLRCSSSGAFGSQTSLDGGVCRDGGGGGAGGGGGGGGGFSCSVNNLDTDCVSPRVSTNSLASQMDNPDTCGVLGFDPVLGAAAADLRPLYGRGGGGGGGGRTGPQSDSLIQHLSPRRLLLVAGGGGGLATVGPDGVPVARSTSCPSVAHQVRRHPLSSSSTPFGGTTAADPSQTPQGRPDFGSKCLQIGSIESDSFNVTTPTEGGESVDRVSPHCADEHAPAAAGDCFFRADADRILAAVERQQQQQQQQQGTLRQTPAAAAAVDEGEDGRTMSRSAQQQQTAIDDEEKNSLDATALNDGQKVSERVSRNLARTKCLHWLNSLDDGD